MSADIVCPHERISSAVAAVLVTNVMGIRTASEIRKINKENLFLAIAVPVLI